MRHSRWWAVLAMAAIPTIVALALRLPSLTISGALMLLLCAIVVVAATTNLVVAVLTAVAAFLMTNWFLVPPYRTLFVASTDDVVVLFVFLGSATLASLAVTRAVAAKERYTAARVEAGALRDSVITPATEADPATILRRIAMLYGMPWVELRDDSGGCVADAQGPDLEGAMPITLPLADGYSLVAQAVPTIGQDTSLLTTLGQAAVRAHEARTLAAEAAELESLDRERSALLASVGHDLRTPIAAITVSAAALLHDLPEAARRELIEGIGESAARLDRLVSDLLDMSRLEAGKVVAQVGPTDLADVCASALAAVGNPRIDVRVPDDLPPVMADAGLLERVVANLVVNALRHGKPPVILAAGPGWLTVRDHGEGLSADAYARALEPFSNSGDRHAGGSGLGLTIAARFCAAMGARLVATTPADGGLAMTVELESE